MTTHNRNLLVIFLGLLLVNVVFFFLGSQRSGVSFDENKFMVTDTTGISGIQIGEGVVLSKTTGTWRVNDQYPVDPSVRQLLFSILTRVKVKKPVEIAPEEGIEVSVGGASPLSFRVWGNPTKTKTYFALTGSEEVFEVHIPGYNEYLGGLFELRPAQWRDRLVIDASWRTIQKLTLDYQRSDDSDFTINFDKDFFVVQDIAPIDSNAVVNYLNLFEYFQTNEWLSTGRFEKYDSLSKMPPLATLTIEAIDQEAPVVLDIFPKLSGDRFYLLMTYEGSMLVVDDRRMREILLKKEDFKYKK